MEEPADDYEVLLLTRELNEIIEDDLTLVSDPRRAWTNRHQAELVRQWVFSHVDCVPSGSLSEHLERTLNGDEQRRFRVAQAAAARASGTTEAGVAASLDAIPVNPSGEAVLYSPQVRAASVPPMPVLLDTLPRLLMEELSMDWMSQAEQTGNFRFMPEVEGPPDVAEHWGSSPTLRSATPNSTSGHEAEPGRIEDERLMLSTFVREMSTIFGHHQLSEDRFRFEPRIRMWARQNRHLVPTRKGSTVGLTSEQKRRLRIAWDEVEKMELETQHLANLAWAARFA
ncbi:hypothetical protein Tdes44962_MAKER08784 [Teratosphaeria destructans]|uniref:Uncharacterized protein n=1 Tax=Teratosphaeria destructans TaxID=418781 RepID=A0A9W7SVK9_9PEZI|nr:hypothetical protein Tdes44962_MAKER08784 [Teratosphaeria destructans]